MPYLGSIQFFLYFIYFFISVFLAFFIPGFLLLRKISLTPFQKCVLSFVLGMVLWGWQGFIFGYLHLRLFSYIYLVILLFVFLKSIQKYSFRLSLPKMDWILGIIITVGVILQLLGIFFMGARTKGGIILCCGHVQDNNLELSIISEITQRFPPFEPGMYGQPLQNYHYWGHLVLAELIRVFHLPLVTTTYQYATVLFSLLFGLLLIAVSGILQMKKGFSRWLVFFAYFGGDSSYIIPLFQGRGLQLPITAMEHGAQLFFNYPRALSVIVFLGGFGLFLRWLKDKKLFTGMLAAIILGSTIGFKVYTGIFVLIGYAAFALFLLLKKKFRFILPLFLIVFLSAIIYFPVNAHAGGLFYTGFWRVNDFIVSQGINLSRMELAREIYENTGNHIHVLYFEFIFTSLFIIVTFGSKLIGLFQNRQSLKQFPIGANIYLLSGFILCFIAGMFFWQNVGGPNTFNFLVLLLIFGCLYAALASDYWTRKLPKSISVFLVIVIIILTVPRVFYSSYVVINQLKTTNIIQNQELPALKYLREKTAVNSIFIASPDMTTEYNSPYIPYMTQRASFLSGIDDELDAHGIDHKKRSELYQEIFTSSDSARVKKIFRANNISYIYIPSAETFPVATTSSWLKVVFNNNDIKIIKADPQ